MEDQQTVTIHKELGASHADFFRILPRVLNGISHTIDGRKIVVDEPTRRLEINISGEQQRKLGALMTLRYTFVEITFTGYSEAERHQFLEVFDFNFFRGGG